MDCKMCGTGFSACRNPKSKLVVKQTMFVLAAWDMLVKCKDFTAVRGYHVRTVKALFTRCRRLKIAPVKRLAG